MSITIVVGFALCLFLVFRGENQRKDSDSSESAKPPAPAQAKRKTPSADAYKRLHNPELLRENAAKVEAKRLAKWKANFPWKPMHDPALKFDPKRHFGDLPKGLINPQTWRPRNSEDFQVADYHSCLKQFFEDETRFSLQFQQIYEILNEHGRGHNPAWITGIFHDLLCYKQTLALPEN